MPQLPRVAVLDPDLVGAVTLAALVDGGLDATCLGSPTPAAAALLARRGLTGHRVSRDGDTATATVAATATAAGRAAGGASPEGTPVISRAAAAGGPARGFTVSIAGRPVGNWDAVVVSSATVTAVTAVIGAGSPWFGGVFHPRADGVYLVGTPGGAADDETSPADVPAQRHADAADDAPGADLDDPLVWAQGSWVGEYLRGRYLLPTYQAMLDRPGLRRGGLRRRGAAGYLRALERELRAGRARAAAAGYPLPLPAHSTAALPAGE